MTQLAQFLRISLCIFTLAGAAAVYAQSSSVPETAAPSTPASPPGNIAPAKRELIMKILAVTNAKAASGNVFDLMWQQSMALSDSIYEQKIERNPNYTAEQKLKAREYYQSSEPQIREQSKNYLKEKFNFDDFVVTSSLTLYDKYFTEAELQGMLDFYTSPTGQKFIAVQPNLMKDTLASSFERVQSIMPDYIEYMDRVMRDQITELEKLIKPVAPVRRGTKTRSTN